MEFALPKNPSLLWPYLKKHSRLFWIQAAGGIFFNTVIVSGPILMGKAMDAANSLYTEGPSPAMVNTLAQYLALLFVATATFQFARYVKRRYIRDLFFRVRADMRAGLLGKTLGRTMTNLEQEDMGDLISRTIGDVEQVASTVESTINEAWDTWLLMLSYFTVLMFYSPRITLICTIPVPLALVLAESMRHPLYKHALRVRQASSRVVSHLRIMLNHVALFRLFGREKAEEQQLEAYASELASSSIRVTLMQAGMMPFYAFLGSLGVVGVLVLGGRAVIAGQWTIGAFSAYLTMFLAMSRRTWVAARVFNRWHAARASWERVLEKLQDDEQPVNGDHTPQEAQNGAELRVKGLNFSYPGTDTRVLHDLNFSVPLGAVVAITGPVGSGKSALAAALSGLYPYEGSTRMAGKELAELPAEERKSLVAYQSQEAFAFSMSLAENITLSGPDDGLERSLYLAALDDDVENFPAGKETMIGERGTRLSGGQRQRMVLARAIHANKPLLILDDPFSAVDIATERRMVERLREHFGGRTIFLFSHRLNSFPLADYVLVLDKGRMSEWGNHKTLMKDTGIYKRIYDAQAWLEDVGNE